MSPVSVSYAAFIVIPRAFHEYVGFLTFITTILQKT